MQLEKKLHEDVYLYSGVLDDPEKLVRLIEELDEDESVQGVIPEWGFWFSNSQDGHSFGSKKDFNIDDIESLESDRKDDVLWVVGQIRGAIKKISEAYYKEHGDQGEPNISPFAGVMKYRPGCDMGPHFDAQAGDESLKYSIVVYLNDNYEGGDLDFRDHDISIKPVSGQLITFPGGINNVHQVIPVKGATRHTIGAFWDYKESEYSAERMAEWDAEIEKVREQQKEMQAEWKEQLDNGQHPLENGGNTGGY